MYHYAALDLAKAVLLLHTIKRDTNRLDLVHELQRHLTRNIVRAELRVQRIRRKCRPLPFVPGQYVPKEDARARKAVVKALRAREDELLQLLFLWRCFGDGIAFVYQSKYSLKHLYYDHQYAVKEPAGFMTEHRRLKPGFRREYRLLCSAIKHKVPAVLADVTNVVRLGDVCALGGREPLPIEVKSSRNTNARTDRQAQQRQVLADFFANDGAEDFRGLGPVRRFALTSQEKNHEDRINECIAEALQTGWCEVQPEPGLTYVACTTWDDARFAAAAPRRSILRVVLSPTTNNLPAYPLTLSFSPGNCIAFMRQRVGIFISIDLAVVKQLFADAGVHATFLMNGTHAVQITKHPENLLLGVERISELMFLRIAVEFQSLAWFVSEASQALELPPSVMTAEEFAQARGLVSEVPADWQGQVDYYERPLDPTVGRPSSTSERQ